MEWPRLYSEWLRKASMVAASRATIHHREASPMAQTVSVLGIDIARLVFHAVGMDDAGPRGAPKASRSQWIAVLYHHLASATNRHGSLWECSYWARCFRGHGHDVRLIAPQFITAYVKSPKHDAHDAEVICEAVTRPIIRFVPIKRGEQQDLQALHRMRTRFMKARTAASAPSTLSRCGGTNPYGPASSVCLTTQDLRSRPLCRCPPPIPATRPPAHVSTVSAGAHRRQSFRVTRAACCLPL
jgi:hypothetical protein